MELTNKFIYENANIIESYPCDLMGSNSHVECKMNYQNDVYIIHTNFSADKLYKPNNIAKKFIDN